MSSRFPLKRAFATRAQCHPCCCLVPISLGGRQTPPSSHQQAQPRMNHRPFSAVAIEPVPAPSSADHDTISSPKYSPIFVAATREHVGKTSVSLALMSGLVKRFGNDRVGFMKPVGQKYLIVQEEDGRTLRVDKDAVLIKSHFELDQLNWSDTSPVLIPKGYTRDYLDGKISYQGQIDNVKAAFANVQNAPSDIILCEGTGHCAVGSIIDASNAEMARLLDAKMVLVANGGLGHSFDELNLNRNWCLERNVEIAGIIINQIQRDKYDQTVSYLQKALAQKWGEHVPLLGCIPDRPFLGCAALCDLEKLFQGSLVSGIQHRLRHYRIQDVNLVAHSLEVFLKQLRANHGRTLYVCHASRSDILLGYLMESVQQITERQHQQNNECPTTADDFPNNNLWESAMVVTGCDETPISTQILEIITSLPKQQAPPVLFTACSTDSVMFHLYKYTPKLNIDDKNRVQTAVAHYEPYIDFDLLLERVKKPQDQSDVISASLSA